MKQALPLALLLWNRLGFVSPTWALAGHECVRRVLRDHGHFPGRRGPLAASGSFQFSQQQAALWQHPHRLLPGKGWHFWVFVLGFYLGFG